ncbi:tetratricopeptide repeat-containing diguanylate cyclase [Solibacillus silvestris]|uniref:tetratricopeptide repeat-containing diguanylate cyclase n=1 Tax=Solibacillus silvestris TaxID=76853 RepID=UPI003F7FB53F
MIMVELEELLTTLKTLKREKQFDDFFELLEKAIEIAKEMNSPRYLIELNLEKSNAYYSLGNLEFALSTLMDYQNLIQESNNRFHLMRLYQGLAEIHSSLQEQEEFYFYLNKAKDLAEEAADHEVLATLHNHFVVYYDRKKQYELALKHGKKSLEYIGQLENSQSTEIYFRLHLNITQVYIKLKKLDEANELLYALSKLVEGKAVTRNLSELYTTRAKWYIAMKYYEEAYTLLQKVKALAIANEDYNFLQEVNRNIVETANLLKDNKKIIESNDEYIDSIQLAQQKNYKVKIQQVELLLSKRKFKDQIYLDPLTNIRNRRYFEKFSQQWLDSEENPKQYYMYFIFDADHFKQVNDVHGHLVGDEVIKKLAQTGKEILSNSATIFSRFGGDEFVGMAKLQDVRQMEEIIAPLHEALSEIKYEVNGKNYAITVSIGAAAMQFKQFTSIDQLMKQADDALYHSKRNGRNQYTLRTNF